MTIDADWSFETIWHFCHYCQEEYCLYEDETTCHICGTENLEAME